MMKRTLKAFVAAVISFTLVFQQTGFAQVAPQLPMPLYLSRITLPADALRPDLVRGLSVDEKGLTNLLLVPGNGKPLSSDQVVSEQKIFSDYLSIGLALPDASFWVNLRPDSPDKVIDPLLAQTDLGKVLLEADLQLKKDLASLTNPATPEGTQYWNKLYQRAEQLFPNENVEIPTYNRPWIVPGEVILKENDNGVIIYKATLKVMLERDHLQSGDALVYAGSDDPRLAQLNDYSSQLIREYILPRLTVIVNSSGRYAQLRQVFNALILAQWMKSRIRQKNGSEDISSFGFESRKLNNLRSTAAWQPKTYFDQYVTSFSKGEYSKEEAVSTPAGITVRRYFSGGINFDGGWAGARPGVSDYDGGSRITRWTATALFGGLSVVMLRYSAQAAYVGEPGTAALTAAAGLTAAAAAATLYKKVGRDGGSVVKVEEDSALAKEFQSKSWGRYQLIQQVAKLESRHTPSEYIYVMKDAQSGEYLLVLTFEAASREIPLVQMFLGQDKAIADAAITYVSKSQAFARDLLKNNRVTVGFYGPSGPEKLMDIFKQQAYDGGDQRLLLKNLALDEKMREGLIDNLNAMNLVLNGRLASARKNKASREEIDALVKALSENVLKTADIQDESAAFMKGLFEDLSGDDFSRKIFALEQFAQKLHTNERFPEKLQQAYWDEAVPLLQKIAVSSVTGNEDYRKAASRDLAQDILLRMAAFKGLKVLNAEVLLMTLSHPDFRVRVKAADAIRAADKELSSAIAAAATDEERLSFRGRLQEKLDQATKDGGINKVRTTRLIKVNLSKDASEEDIKNMLKYSMDYLKWLIDAKGSQQLLQRILILMLLDAQLEDDYDTADFVQSLPDLWGLMNKNEKALLQIAQNPKSPLQVDALIVFAMKADPRTVARKLAMTKARFTARKDTYMRMLTEKVIESVQEQDKDGGKGGLKTGRSVSVADAVEHLHYLLEQNGHAERPDEHILNLQGYFARQERKAVPVENEYGLRDLHPGDLLFYSDKAGAHQAVCLKSEDYKVDYLQFNFPPIPVEMQAVVVENIPLEELPDMRVFSSRGASLRDGGMKISLNSDNVFAAAMGDVLISFMEARRGMPREQIAEELKPVLRAYLAQIPDGLTRHIDEEIENDPIRESLTLDLGGRSESYFAAVKSIAGGGQEPSLIRESRGSVNLKKLAAFGFLFLLGAGLFYGPAGHYSYSKQESDIVMGKTQVASDLPFVLEHGFGKSRADVMRQVTDDAVSGTLAQGDVFNVQNDPTFNPIRQDIEVRDNLLAVVNNTEQDSAIRVEAVVQLGRIYGYLFKQNEVFTAQFEAVVNANRNESYAPVDTAPFKIVYTEITDKLIDIALNDDDPAVRVEAVKQLVVALAVSHDSEVESILSDLAAYDRDPAVMEAAQQALKDGGAQVMQVLANAADKATAEQELVPVLKAYQRSQFHGIPLAESDQEIVKDLEQDIQQDVWGALLRMDVPEAAQIRQLAEEKGFIEKRHPLIEAFMARMGEGVLFEEAGRSSSDALKILGVASVLVFAGLAGVAAYDLSNYDETEFMWGLSNDTASKFPFLLMNDTEARLQMIQYEPIADTQLAGIAMVQHDGKAMVEPPVRIAAIKKIVSNAQDPDHAVRNDYNNRIVVTTLTHIANNADDDMSVRIEAVNALSALTPASAYSDELPGIQAYLSSVALDQKQPDQVRLAAFNGLATTVYDAAPTMKDYEHGERVAIINTTFAVLDNPDYPLQLRIAAVEVLKNKYDRYQEPMKKRIRDHLTAELTDKNNDVELRSMLLSALEYHDEDNVRGLAMDIARDPYEASDLRVEALGSLYGGRGYGSGTGSLELLGDLARNDHDPAVQKEAILLITEYPYSIDRYIDYHVYHLGDIKESDIPEVRKQMYNRYLGEGTWAMTREQIEQKLIYDRRDGGSAKMGLAAEMKEKRIMQLKDIAAFLYQVYADENIKIELKDTEDDKISFDPQYGRKQLSVPLSADPAMVLGVALQFESMPWKRHALERYLNQLMHEDGDVTAGAVSPYADGGSAEVGRYLEHIRQARENLHIDARYGEYKHLNVLLNALDELAKDGTSPAVETLETIKEMCLAVSDEAVALFNRRLPENVEAKAGALVISGEDVVRFANVVGMATGGLKAELYPQGKKDGGELSTARPGLAVNNPGGVDFRATLAGAQVNPANTPAITAAMISQIATQAAFQAKDLAAVQKQLLSRINSAQTAQELPLQELKECLAVCSAAGEKSGETAGQIAACLINILQQEEARGLESSAQVQELLSFAEACQA